MSVREASHAGSWYTDDRQRLNTQLSGWLQDVKPQEDDNFHPPIEGCKAIIGPHAGYSYSGPAAAWAYKSIDTVGIRRVFVLGPSHHVYLDGCALSRCNGYETPIGDLPLDLETIQDLRNTGKFSDMDLETDENEHSIEMHLPYIRKVFEGQNIKLVPILVGAIDTEKETLFGELIAPYLLRDDTFCVVSSDFCHWGARFRYTNYYPDPALVPSSVRATQLSTSTKATMYQHHPIHASISALDHEAMNILTIPANTATKDAHNVFAAYLAKTKNTICGRHPIGVLLGALAFIDSTKSGDQHNSITMRWVRYEQSSKCASPRDSSVSYASAYVIF
ncbi:UPF0103-domain-containing protein [Punctularia strigosozonata HHB-11173 SS5]|uniref:UPF0103-domain-containing protein n=1 Tax=Punctularia strigosozonata (strain HHB-11173) TaxID=741275 RepID=UPI00044169D1|nr:UPF0103-domain-containing protein [Punctularia strigosozonata HHB-11173 SS5]EIN13698.1 UPF0103-domain-containing protein [Punctularia strigosozonata HHB-11173 SS5]